LAKVKTYPYRVGPNLIQLPLKSSANIIVAERPEKIRVIKSQLVEGGKHAPAPTPLRFIPAVFGGPGRSLSEHGPPLMSFHNEVRESHREPRFCFTKH